jgi:hypothetical protein
MKPTRATDISDTDETVFEHVPRDQLPRDDAQQTGKGLTFRTLEHDEFDAPHAIQATDAQGRAAVYVLFERNGKVGRWVSKDRSSEPSAGGGVDRRPAVR